MLLGLAGAVFGSAPVIAKGADDVVIIEFMASTGVDADGTARARWRDKGEGELDFSVELEQMSPGDYDLYVAGLYEGTISVGGLGEGEIEFERPLDGPKPLFDFDVFGQSIEVRQGATVFFSDVFDGQSAAAITADRTRTELAMVNTGPDFDARGKLKYRTRRGKVRFSVEVEHLDAGTYTLLVGGAPVGEITTAGGEETEVEFQDPVEAGKVLLNFDPLGRQVDVALGAEVYLTGFLPAADSATGTRSPNTTRQTARNLGKARSDKLRVALANTGVARGASGKATLAKGSQVEFEVEIEDVVPGDYGLFVDGLQRGTLVAGTGSAELDFSTSPEASQALLDFDVQGMLVEVRNGAGETILAAVYPVSVQAALGSFKKERVRPASLKLNLVNLGADLDVTGMLHFRRAASGRERLDVRVNDMPPGNYALVYSDGSVEGSSAAVLRVNRRGRGRIVLVSPARGRQIDLDFDPTGVTLEIVGADDTAFLAVDVPALAP